MLNKLSIDTGISPDITILAGFDFGREIWKVNECSLLVIDVNADYEIEFPEQIEGIASSFVNGFFEKIIEEIGAEKAAERLHINNAELESNVKEDILLNK
jgi:hypothetical protein